MKILFSIMIPAMLLLSCHHSSNSEALKKEKPAPEKQSFFPVTAYIKGELYELKASGINPLKYTTTGNHTDSAWLKHEDLDVAVREFLTPEIDSLNLVSLFTEKSFLDQSIGAVTFTYDATGPLPDTMTLKHWDVYIDPETGKVKRIYLVKEISPTRTLQMTWLSGKWCKITSIILDHNGTSAIEKEEKITWDF
jgi:hypothetical protein